MNVLRASNTTNNTAKTRIVCPKLTNANFLKFKDKINQLVDYQLKNKITIPTVFVFSETVLSGYKFNISNTEVFEQINSIRQNYLYLKNNFWFSFFFSIDELRTYNMLGKLTTNPSTTGYFVSPEGIEQSPKRVLSDYDHVNLMKFSSIDYKSNEGAWVARYHKLTAAKKSFPSVTTPDGVKIEGRVCIDIDASPMVAETNTITVLSAMGLGLELLQNKAHLRKAIIINDGSQINRPKCISLIDDKPTIFPLNYNLMQKNKDTGNLYFSGVEIK